MVQISRACLRYLGLIAGLAAALSMGTARAADIAGVTLAERFTPAPGHTLVLNGAGVRTKFFFKIYVGALYLPQRTGDAQTVLTMPGAKSVHMHILYDEISAQRLERSWRERFKDNHMPEQLRVLRPRIERYIRTLRPVKRGDEVHLTFLPDVGTRVRVNGEVIDTIPGEDFYRALLRAWVGEHPADQGLKAGMLGSGG